MPGNVLIVTEIQFNAKISIPCIKVVLLGKLYSIYEDPGTPKAGVLKFVVYNNSKKPKRSIQDIKQKRALCKNAKEPESHLAKKVSETLETLSNTRGAIFFSIAIR